MIFFQERDLALRAMQDQDEDYALITRWLSDERVLAYYEGRDQAYTFEEAQETFSVAAMLAQGETPCIIEYQDRPAGYLQFYQADLHEYQFEQDGRVYALDLFIGEPDLWGQGLGTRLVGRLLQYLFDEKSADWVILDPHVENTRAVRCYEKCGFQKIKLLPAHELHEGRYEDCWLMGVKRPE